VRRLELLRLRLGIGPEVDRPDEKHEKATMNDVMSTAIAKVPTKSGSRYLQQLAKHWSHNLTVEFTAEQSRIIFPKDARGASWSADALVTMTAQPETLDVQIDASSPEHLEALKGAVARHLDRFAFREAPLTFEWS
jgi:hypothetical protein